jgi:hypothetical protein
MHYCFITGFLRSGTTLLEKLVHALPGACIGPQPFPFLYYDTKRAFLRARGAGEERYPLGSLFREERYRPEDFQAFLRSHRLTPQATAASFAAMRGYSGWKLPALAAHAGQAGEGSFAEVYRKLCERLPGILGAEASRLLGAKEVFCEEFIPYFLAEGVSVLLVLRDVRDVLTSLKFGSGAAYANRDLPLLHIVRQWRKSVAFALELSGRPGFEAVRYEELVARPRAWLDALAGRWGMPAAAPGAVEDLRDQEGREWQSNSSFAPARGVSRDSVGRFAEHLPAAWLAAVEWLCAPEMKVLGLRPAADPATDAWQDLVGGEELDAERQRLRVIGDPRAPEAEQRRWCIFPGAYRRLGSDSGAGSSARM